MIGLGRVYAVTFVGVAITAQQDLVYLKPAADKPIIIEEIKLAVVGGNADAGDAQEELLDIELIRLSATVTVGAGGAAFTPLPFMIGDAAAGFTSRINDTTKATSSGASQVMDADGMNNRIPYLYIPVPEHRVVVSNAAAAVIRLNTTPVDALAVNGKVTVREFS